MCCERIFIFIFKNFLFSFSFTECIGLSCCFFFYVKCWHPSYKRWNILLQIPQHTYTSIIHKRFISKKIQSNILWILLDRNRIEEKVFSRLDEPFSVNCTTASKLFLRTKENELDGSVCCVAVRSLITINRKLWYTHYWYFSGSYILTVI